MDELPPLNTSNPPAFHTLDDERFEEFCCALLDNEPGIKTADRHATPRKPQYGADIIGNRDDGRLEIVSCKCYSKAKKGDIPTACDEFLREWEPHWKDKGVARFILAIAADVRSTPRRQEIEQQSTRFESICVEFEVWGPRTLQEKMRSHPGIVAQYLGSEYVKRYCGQQQPQISDTPIESALLQQLAQMQSALAEEVDSALDDVSVDLRHGRDERADRELDRLRNDSQRWAALSVESRARVVRLQALRELRSGTPERATDLANEADALDDGTNGARLRASLVAESGDLEGALELLATSDAQEDVRLRASLWLALEKPERALEELSGLSGAEKFALQAHAFAGLGQVEKAQSSLSEAEQLEPSLLNVRRAGIAIRYWRAISPGIAYRLDAGLQPVPLGLVRADAEAVQLLGRACELARQTLRDPALDPTWAEEFETWQLACLANQREHTEEAEAYAQALLQRPRPHRGAIVWSMARGYAIKHRREIRRLEDMLGGPLGEVSHLTVLLALALDQGKPQRARRALSDHGARFPRHEKLLDEWRAIVDAELGNSGTDSLPHTIALQQTATAGDWDSVARQVRERLAEADLAPAYTGLESLAVNGQWHHVEPFIPALLDRIQTADAVTMACFAAYHSGQQERAMDIATRYQAHFAEAKLPLPIRRIRLQGLQQSGRLPEAYEEADGLASEGHLTDIISAVNTRLMAGDVGGAVPLIRRVAEHSDLPPQAALEYAHVVRHVDPTVARELWMRTRDVDLQGRLAELAVTTAFELGLDDQAGPAIEALTRNTQAPDSTAHMMTIDELPNFLEQRRRHAEQLESEYRHGRMPLHVVSDALNVPMADWFARAFSGDQQFPLFLLHGNRALARPGVSASDFRLRLDLTGLFTAFHLDLLGEIERRWRPIELPFSLPQTLNGMERQLRPIQPAEVRANELLVSKVDEQQIGVLDVESVRAGTDDNEESACPWTIVDYTENLTRPAEANPRRILDVLSDLRADSPDRLKIAARNLGAIGTEEPIGPIPEPGQQIAFSANTITLFARAGLLHALTTTFSVSADSRYLQLARAELAEHRRKAGIADELHALGDRISNGIQNGVYQLLSSLETETEKDEAEEGQAPISAAGRCFVEAIGSPTQQRTVLWADDRMINRFRHTEAIEVACVYDILNVLRSEKEISEGDYFTHVLRLREGGVRYIPLTSDEVLYFLRAAPSHDGLIHETRGLRALRRNLAEIALSEEVLELDLSQDVGRDRADEFPLLQMVWRVPRETLVRAWHEGWAQDEPVQARANWIYETLVVDHFTRLPPTTDPKGRQRLLASGLAGYIIDGLQISDQSEKTGARAAYFGWLDAAILAPHTRAEPSIAMDVAETVGDTLDGLLRDTRNSDSNSHSASQEQVAIILADYVRSLPERVRDSISDRSDLMQHLPLRIGRTVSFGEDKFDAIALFESIAEAMRSGRAEVTSEQGEIVSLEWDSEKPACIRGTCIRENGQTSWNLEDPGLAVLADDVGRRRQVLRDHACWIDRSPEERAATIETIVNLAEPHARMLRLDDERKESAEFQYRSIEQALARRESIGPDQLNSITANMVVRHLNIDATSEGDRLDYAVGQLLHGLGPKDAIRRMAGIPIDLPRPVTEVLWQLSPQDRDSLIHELGAQSASPVRQMRAVDWARSVPDCEVPIQSLINHLFDEIEPRTKLLHENALWVERSFEADCSWRDLPRDIRLLTVWFHAERLTDLLLRAGVSADSAASSIAQWAPRDFGPWFMRDPADDQDPCSPIAITDKSLLWAIVGSAVGDAAGDLLDTEHLSTLTEAVSHVTENGARWPDPALMANSYRPSCLDFLVGRDHSALRKALNDKQLADRLDPAFSETIVGEALCELEIDPSDSQAWTKLLMGRPRELGPEDIDRLLAILERLEIDRLRATNSDSALAVIVWLCRSPTMMEYDNARDRAEELLVTLFRGFDTQPGDGSATSNAEPTVHPLTTLGDATLYLARNSCGDKPRSLAILVERIVEEAPEAATLWRSALPAISRALPLEANRQIWPTILRLRAEREPSGAMA